MLHLLDANVLIDANRDYYPISRVPEFWEWLTHVAEKGKTKVPVEIYDELKEGTDVLATWTRDHREQILLDEGVREELMARVIEQGYAKDLNDEEIETIGQDAFLIAYALADVQQRRVVTTETSRPRRKRANRHIPDVCRDLGIRCYNTFEFLRALDFTTQWKAR